MTANSVKNMKRKLISGFITFILSAILAVQPVGALAATGDSSQNRIGGMDQYETAALIAQKGWISPSDFVIVAAGMNHNLVDALAAGPLAALLKAPILLTDGDNKLNSYARQEIERLKPKTVFVTSGTAVIKQSVIDELKKMNGIEDVIPLGGYDQADTSANIAQEMVNHGAQITKIVIAGGWASPADALSAAAIAGAEKMPILLTAQSQVPGKVKEFISNQQGVTDSYVIGGTAVVDKALEKLLPGTVHRLAGDTKYDTNLEVLNGFSPVINNDMVYVANGETSIDALAGVPLAARTHSPIVLVDRSLNDKNKAFVKNDMFPIGDAVALGGEAVVDSEVIAQMLGKVSITQDGAVVGSEDPANLKDLGDNVVISGNNVTLKNAIAPYNVHIKGSNVTLSNIHVKGTIGIEADGTGQVLLDNVSAARILVMKGADLVSLNNVTSGELYVYSPAPVKIEAKGTTAIQETMIGSEGVLNAAGGSFGKVYVAKIGDYPAKAELQGTFEESVFAASPAEIKTVGDGIVADLAVVNPSKEEPVVLRGQYRRVRLYTDSMTKISLGSRVNALYAYSNARLDVDSSSAVEKTYSQGFELTVTTTFSGIFASEYVDSAQVTTALNDRYAGYEAGFKIRQALNPADIAHVEISLYDSQGNLLVTNKSTDKLITADTQEITTVFDLRGQYTDERWTMGTWNNKVQPASASIVVTAKNGNTYRQSVNQVTVAPGTEGLAEYLTKQ